MSASVHDSPETPDFGKWEGLREQKHTFLGSTVVLLGPLFKNVPCLALTLLGLCCVAGLMLHFNRNTHGVLGALAVATLMCVMGLVSRHTTSEQHAKSRENAAVPPPESGDE